MYLCKARTFILKLVCHSIVKLAWILLVVLYLYQFVLIYKYSVDIPFKDEWVYFKPDHPLQLPETFNLNWLFARISEHNIVSTNILTWVNYKIFGLDYYKQKIINYIMFAILLLLVIRLKNSIIGIDRFQLFPMFLIFLLSPIAVENHTWGFQSQIHLALIFFLLMLICLRKNSLETTTTLLFITASVMAIYSFAAGVILALVCLFFRDLQVIVSVAKAPRAGQKTLLNAAFCTIVIGVAVTLWFKGYKRPDFVPPGVWPNEMAFWDYFLNLLSFGFGFDTQNLLPGAFFLIFSLFPVLAFSSDSKRRFEPDVICVSAAIIALLAVLLSISFGRASIGDPKTSRYAEISFMLVPLIAMAWWLLLKNSTAKNLFLSLLWISCFCSYLDNWSPALYRETYHSDRTTLDCVNNYFQTGGDAVCQEYWITPAHLEKAKNLKIHFTTVVTQQLLNNN